MTASSIKSQLIFLFTISFIPLHFGLFAQDKKLSAEQNIEMTEDFSGMLFNNDNDLYFYSLIKNEFKRLTNSADKEVNPILSPDGKKIAFTRNKDLYVVNVETGKETRLTNDASDIIYNGYASWVYMEEIIGRSLTYRA